MYVILKASNAAAKAISFVGLLVIINDPVRQQQLLEYVTEQASRLEPLLHYFGGRVYKDVCSRAEQHAVQKDTVL